VAAEIEERVAQEMPESHDHKDEAEADESVASPQTDDDKRACDKFDHRNRNANHPESPDREKSVREWQEVFLGMLDRSQLKDFPNAGHEKDQAQNEARKEHSPGTVSVFVHELV
jgi:hypothetical protein